MTWYIVKGDHVIIEVCYRNIYLDGARGMDPGARESVTVGRAESSGSVMDDGRHGRGANAEGPIE